MLRTRIVCHAIVLFYLLITLAAFVYTMTRVTLPFPHFLVYWSYGMMAPYQGDTDFNDDLHAEGRLPDGSFRTIDLDPYFPVGFGEKNVRKHLRSFQTDHDAYRRAFADFALQLLARERHAGKPYDAVRLTWQQWPRSPAGYDFLKHAPFLEETPIILVAL